MDSKIYTHKLLNNDPTVANALKFLRPHLPISIPIYRRLQFGRFFEATTLLTNIADLKHQSPINEPWLIAFVDRTCRPETELYMYASWESTSSDSTTEEEQKQDYLIKNLFKAIKDLGPLPISLHQDVLDKASASLGNDTEPDSSGVSRKGYTAHLLNPNLILCGAIHSSTTKILERNNLIKHVFDAGLVPNRTFIFDTSKLPSIDIDDDALPPTLSWGELRYEHFPLVRSRTQIPRQDRTLAELPNVAIYHDSVPIAWVFVGLDGSLTTLHVEEEWRGRGLAGKIAVKLWREKMGKFWDRDGSLDEKREVGHGTGERWAHDYVICGNEASRKVSERLGGRYYADTFWVRVDLGVVLDAALTTTGKPKE